MVAKLPPAPSEPGPHQHTSLMKQHIIYGVLVPKKVHFYMTKWPIFKVLFFTSKHDMQGVYGRGFMSCESSTVT